MSARRLSSTQLSPERRPHTAELEQLINSGSEILNRARALTQAIDAHIQKLLTAEANGCSSPTPQPDQACHG